MFMITGTVSLEAQILETFSILIGLVIFARWKGWYT